MRRISANYIFPITSKPLKNGVLELDDEGNILNVIDTKGELKEPSKLEYYNGILVPGFVNTHCHIELSHLKGKIKEKGGLPEFISAIRKYRGVDSTEQEIAMQKADMEMFDNGIVAVGDITNFASSLKVKEKSKIKYHSFIEVFGFDPDRAEEIFQKAKNIQNQAAMSCSIVPHAPYSVSSKLLKRITETAYTDDSIISIHNQETESENELFIEGRGALKESLEKLGVDFSNLQPTGFNSMQSTMINLPKCNKTLLVHNTYTSEEDINWLLNYFYPLENKSIQKNHIHLLYFALCPNANLYIENRLPNISMFIKNGLKMTIGTDSLASNHQLSVLEEIKTIQNHFPGISLEMLLQWAAINGAESLGFDKDLGSFEKGKTPGINLISNINFQNMKFTKDSQVKRLV